MGVLQWEMRVLEGETDLHCNERCVATRAKHCNGRRIIAQRVQQYLPVDALRCNGTRVLQQETQLHCKGGRQVLQWGTELCCMEDEKVLQWKKAMSHCNGRGCIALQWRAVDGAAETLQQQTEHCNGG